MRHSFVSEYSKSTYSHWIKFYVHSIMRCMTTYVCDELSIGVSFEIHVKLQIPSVRPIMMSTLNVLEMDDGVLIILVLVCTYQVFVNKPFGSGLKLCICAILLNYYTDTYARKWSYNSITKYAKHKISSSPTIHLA